MIEYPTKILLATDGGADSVRAGQVAVSLAAKHGAELHVVHVGHAASSTSGVTVEGGALPGEPPGYAERQAEKMLEGQVEQLQSTGGAVTEPHLRMGQPAAEVITLSEELEADLLVVGSGGPRPVRRAVAATTRRPAIGRVSEVIVRTAPCPVLVIRGEAVPNLTGA
jgi:nucleotide-binding universal stress UspA family protein